MEQDGKSTGFAIGLMSGTSGDGIDVALVHFTETSGLANAVFPEMRLVASVYTPYTEEQRRQVFQLFRSDVSARYVAVMDTLLGNWFGEAAAKLMKEAGIKADDVSVIGCHGQTVYHAPEAATTWQIGNPAVIAMCTDCPVVSDFRLADVAAGGQGAPLVPYFDYAYLTSPDITRVILNIGGISNVTVLPRAGKLGDVIAFDTGPGNMLIDALVQNISAGARDFDMNGQMAAQGTPAMKLIEKWIESDAYVHMRPPKSTGREQYGSEFLQSYEQDMAQLSPSDRVATMTRFVATTVALGIQFVVSDAYELIISGGGRYNQTLIRWIAELAQPDKVLTSDEQGIPSDMKEAMAFALLAWQFQRGRPTNVPSATGARQLAMLGQWTPRPIR